MNVATIGISLELEIVSDGPVAITGVVLPPEGGTVEILEGGEGTVVLENAEGDQIMEDGS